MLVAAIHVEDSVAMIQLQNLVFTSAQVWGGPSIFIFFYTVLIELCIRIKNNMP